MLLVLTLLCGGLYPAAVTLAARLVFPRQAGGSVITVNGKAVGSELLAQRFSDTRYFWPRPSAGDDGTNFATIASAASNKGPTSSELQTKVAARAAAFRTAHGLATNGPVPAEMVFTSGSGLDPHISPQAARLQMARVSRARKFSADQQQRVTALVEQFIEPPQLGFLGEPRVNVLRLNLALDALQ